ncbi:transmembrane protein 209-like [Drosophila biarmipes]|uniref:transmembrane protein 209-like n=1 Tax=Drosophila biarmipes TaxID=125945 RepID=UPI0007E79C49|nr:transmembrane protein 209-like [Drosophila biarmipes]
MDCKRSLCSPLKKNQVVQRSLDLRLRGAQARSYLKVCCANLIVLLLLLLDNWTMGYICDQFYCYPYWRYTVVYSIATVMALSALACFGKYLWLICGDEQVIGTERQKCLLDCGYESPFGTVYTRPVSKARKSIPEIDCDDRPMVNWHSSHSDSCWWPKKTGFTKKIYPKPSSIAPCEEVCRDDFITDIRRLPALMRRARRERSAAEDSKADVIRNCFKYQLFQKKNPYQFIPLPAEDSSDTKDCKVSNSKDISPNKMLQYVSNLRYWISITILHRLVTEIEYMDEVFQELGFYHIKIGAISLERLKLIAEDRCFVRTYLPMLPKLLTFLQPFTNQEYLVQRIKELARGDHIAAFQWGNTRKADYVQDWLDDLPTDAAIVFHLFCVYLDSQLMPMPQDVGYRPFFSRFVIIGDKRSIKENVESRVNNKASCAIMATSYLDQLPKFNFISDNRLHDCVYNCNNLFYVIIQFLTYMRDKQGSELEGVSLGKSGINIMCVIEN